MAIVGTAARQHAIIGLHCWRNTHSRLPAYLTKLPSFWGGAPIIFRRFPQDRQFTFCQHFIQRLLAFHFAANMLHFGTRQNPCHELPLKFSECVCEIKCIERCLQSRGANFCGHQSGRRLKSKTLNCKSNGDFQQEIIVYTRRESPAKPLQARAWTETRNSTAHSFSGTAKWARAKLAVDSSELSVSKDFDVWEIENFAIFIFDLPFWLKSFARNSKSRSRPPNMEV